MPELHDELDRILHDARVRLKLPGVSAAVARSAEIEWSAALGIGEVEAGTPVGPRTQFRIGSITKTFTAVAILQLREQGALGLNDRVTQHIPECPFPDVTLRQLLSHTSGVQREYPVPVWETLAFPTVATLLARVPGLEQVLPAGAVPHYSNLGYALLGMIVSRAAGKRYEHRVDESVIRSIGLCDTTWRPGPGAARGYFVSPLDESVVSEPDAEIGALAPAGQLWSTAGDTARWGAALAGAGGGVLPEHAVAEMHELHGMRDARWTRGFGLGLMLYRRGDRVFAGHEGSWAGFRAGVAWSREDGMAAAVLANSRTAVGLDLLAIDMVEASAGQPARETSWQPANPAPEEVSGILGQWWREGEPFIFTWHSDSLTARPAGSQSEDDVEVFARVEVDVYRSVRGLEQGELLRVVRSEAGTVKRLYWATYPLWRQPWERLAPTDTG